MKAITALILAISLLTLMPLAALAAEAETQETEAGDVIPIEGPEVGIDELRQWIEEQQAQDAGASEFDDSNVSDGQINYPNSVTGERFTGMGTVVDYVVTGYRHFYTIVTREDTVFYMIIDFDKNGDNVYFLAPVDRSTLLWEDYKDDVITEEEYFAIQESIQQYEMNEMQQNRQGPDGEYLQMPDSQSGQQESDGEGGYDFTRLIIMGAAFLAVGGFGYYNVIYKKKKAGGAPKADDEEVFEDDDDDDGYDEDEDDESEPAEDEDDGA